MRACKLDWVRNFVRSFTLPPCAYITCFIITYFDFYLFSTLTNQCKFHQLHYNHFQAHHFWYMNGILLNDNNILFLPLLVY